MKTGAFSQIIGKVFRSQSWYQGTVFSVYTGANWEATNSSLTPCVDTKYNSLIGHIFLAKCDQFAVCEKCTYNCNSCFCHPFQDVNVVDGGFHVDYENGSAPPFLPNCTTHGLRSRVVFLCDSSMTWTQQDQSSNIHVAWDRAHDPCMVRVYVLTSFRLTHCERRPALVCLDVMWTWDSKENKAAGELTP